MLLNVFWKFSFPPFMVLIIAILNDGKLNPECAIRVFLLRNRQIFSNGVFVQEQ